MPALAQKIDFGHGNQRAELPLLQPTLGPAMIDIRRLREVERGPLPWPSRVVEFLQVITKTSRGRKEPRKKK